MDYSALQNGSDIRGIAMENAIDEVKLAADETTLSNDEDGVAVVLESVVEALENPVC